MKFDIKKFIEIIAIYGIGVLIAFVAFIIIFISFVAWVSPVDVWMKLSVDSFAAGLLDYIGSLFYYTQPWRVYEYYNCVDL